MSGDFENRVETLERNIRRWRQACMVVALGVATMVTMGQVGNHTVDTTDLVLRDEGGLVRARLGLQDGNPGLAFYDKDGRQRVGLFVEAEGPIFTLTSEGDRTRVVVAERNDAAVVVLRDPEGAPRAALTVQEDGSPTIFLLDENMNLIYRIP